MEFSGQIRVGEMLLSLAERLRPYVERLAGVWMLLTPQAVHWHGVQRLRRVYLHLREVGQVQQREVSGFIRIPNRLGSTYIDGIENGLKQLLTREQG